MNLEVWSQKSRMAAASRPHQSPRQTGEDRLQIDDGGVLLLPCKNLQNLLKACRSFMLAYEQPSVKKDGGWQIHTEEGPTEIYENEGQEPACNLAREWRGRKFGPGLPIA